MLETNLIRNFIWILNHYYKHISILFSCASINFYSCELSKNTNLLEDKNQVLILRNEQILDNNAIKNTNNSSLSNNIS